MSLQVLGPKPYFWQWDTGQKLVVDNHDCGEVHFDNGTTDLALVIQIKTDQNGNRVADVPNILLQSAKPLRAYLFQETENGAMTSTLYTFQVLPRPRPEDYVYTETEVLNYSNLVSRIDQIEKNGVSDEQIATAVQTYLDANPLNELPDVSEADNGKILRVVDGAWETVELPVYDGEYAVTPKADDSTTLETAQKYMTQNVNVRKIPYYEVDNAAGGSTIYIGTDDEIIIE